MKSLCIQTIITCNISWISKVSTALANIVRDGTRIEEEFRPSWCQKKIKGLWTNVTILYPNEDEEKNEGFWRKIWGMVESCKRVFYKGVREKFGST